MTTDLSLIPETECACNTCQGFCSRPCFPSPQEAVNIMDASYGTHLMLDWWNGEDDTEEDIFVLCGANPGYQGRKAPVLLGFMGFLLPSDIDSGCMFRQPHGGCVLHPIGLKPIEGRLTHHSHDREKASGLHAAVVRMWDTDEGRNAVDRWKVQHAKEAL